jgi:hypothetical protein
MKIKFKNSRFIKNIVIGSVFVLIGIDSFIDVNNDRESKYFIFCAGIIYVASAVYEMIFQYLTIEEGTIKSNALLSFRKKIKLNEVYWIKESDRNYYLKTEKTVFKINTDLIETNSLLNLHVVLKELNLPNDKTPFQ